MEKFCLKWNDFQGNITTSYKDLRESSDFSDVTLVCEDNQKVEAHRVILSACSPFFLTMLKRNKHSHPMIYMRGLKTNILLSIVDFIYYGEANIFQEDLDQFLVLAEELQLKGLSGTSKEEPIQGVPHTKKPEAVNLNANAIKERKQPQQIQKKYEIPDVPFDAYGTLVISDTNSSKVKVDNVSALDEQIDSMMYKADGSNEWTCSTCEKSSRLKANIRQHVEANHIEGIAYACDQCGKVSRSKFGLIKHISRKHNSK